MSMLDNTILKQPARYDAEKGIVECFGDLTKGVTLKTLPGDTGLVDTPNGLRTILTREVPFVKDEGDRLYYYLNGNYWSEGKEFAIELILDYLAARDLNKQIKTKFIKETVELITYSASRLPATPSLRYINLKNGIYDLKDKTLFKHTPKLLSTVQLPITYDPTATCPHWDKFIQATFPEDTWIVAYELIAWLMIPLTTIKKMILLLGSGNNGKSIFLHGVQEFLGAHNYSHVPLHDLVRDKFAASRLRGKLANICGEISAGRLDNTDKIKSLTGGDSIDAERKYGERFTFLPFARHIYSANELFSTKDKSDGFISRFCIIPFNNRFKNDPAMGGKLRRDLGQPGELSGMLNKALALIGKVKSEGITQSQSMTNAVEEYLSQDSTVLRYIRSNVVVASHQSVLEFDNLFEAYREWCVRRTIEPVGRTVFGRELAKYRPDWKQKRVSSGRRYYYGLSIISRPLTVVSA